jgi:hypothetical protein
MRLMSPPEAAEDVPRTKGRLSVWRALPDGGPHLMLQLKIYPDRQRSFVPRHLCMTAPERSASQNFGYVCNGYSALLIVGLSPSFVFAVAFAIRDFRCARVSSSGLSSGALEEERIT